LSQKERKTGSSRRRRTTGKTRRSARVSSPTYADWSPTSPSVVHGADESRASAPSSSAATTPESVLSAAAVSE
jgi:hypothetical protein